MATKESTPTTTRTPRRREEECPLAVEHEESREEDIVEFIRWGRHNESPLTREASFYADLSHARGITLPIFTVDSFSHFRIYKDRPPERWLELDYAFSNDVLKVAAGCCRHNDGTLTIEFATKEPDEENPAYCNETVHGSIGEGSYFHPNCKQCLDSEQYLSTWSLVIHEANAFSRAHPIDLTTST